MHDQSKPGTAESSARVGIDDTSNNSRWDVPRHTPMGCPEQHRIRQPVPFTEHTFHLGQHHTTPEKFFTQQVIANKLERP